MTVWGDVAEMGPAQIKTSEIRCLVDCGIGPFWESITLAAALLSLIGMLVYGLALAGRSPSTFRTLVKVCAIAGLAVVCAIWDAPWLLLAALAACAVGDALLAGDPKRWLPHGMVAFLVGHAFYIFLFAQHRPLGMEPNAFQMTGIGLVAAAAVAMLWFLWKHLGPLRPAVVLYVLVIATMTGSSFLLAPGYSLPMVGSVAFMASDAVLAISLFRDEKLFGSPRATNWAVWFLYYGAQILIASAFIGLREPL